MYGNLVLPCTDCLIFTLGEGELPAHLVVSPDSTVLHACHEDRVREGGHKQHRGAVRAPLVGCYCQLLTTVTVTQEKTGG